MVNVGTRRELPEAFWRRCLERQASALSLVRQFDDDADGTVDRTIAPLAPVTIVDTGAPASTVTATPYTAGDGSTRYHVTVTATPTAARGVDRIEWLHTSDGMYEQCLKPMDGPWEGCNSTTRSSSGTQPDRMVHSKLGCRAI